MAGEIPKGLFAVSFIVNSAILHELTRANWHYLKLAGQAGRLFVFFLPSGVGIGQFQNDLSESLVIIYLDER
jgi:hypothetical protein